MDKDWRTTTNIATNARDKAFFLQSTLYHSRDNIEIHDANSFKAISHFIGDIHDDIQLVLNHLEKYKEEASHGKR